MNKMVGQVVQLAEEHCGFVIEKDNDDDDSFLIDNERFLIERIQDYETRPHVSMGVEESGRFPRNPRPSPEEDGSLDNFPGVGPETRKVLRNNGIVTATQLLIQFNKFSGGTLTLVPGDEKDIRWQQKLAIFRER